MQWCESVPIFSIVAKEDVWMVKGQLYRYNGVLFELAVYAPGCGRELVGGYCHSCRAFLPEPIERPERGKKKKAPDGSGKDAAAGEDREVQI
jgi:hypothetical protein